MRVGDLRHWESVGETIQGSRYYCHGSHRVSVDARLLPVVCLVIERLSDTSSHSSLISSIRVSVPVESRLLFFNRSGPKKNGLGVADRILRLTFPKSAVTAAVEFGHLVYSSFFFIFNFCPPPSPCDQTVVKGRSSMEIG